LLFLATLADLGRCLHISKSLFCWGVVRLPIVETGSTLPIHGRLALAVYSIGLLRLAPQQVTEGIADWLAPHLGLGRLRSVHVEAGFSELCHGAVSGRRGSTGHHVALKVLQRKVLYVAIFVLRAVQTFTRDFSDENFDNRSFQRRALRPY